jgi:hypothetical protein
LAAGIRGFAADIVKLEKVIAEKIEAASKKWVSPLFSGQSSRRKKSSMNRERRIASTLVLN